MMAKDELRTVVTNGTVGDINGTLDNATVTINEVWRIASTEYQVTAAVVTCLIIATVTGNSSVILCFIVEKPIRTFNNIFILSLAMADLLVGIVIMPLTLTYDLTGQWSFGGPVCVVLQYLDAVCCCCSILNLCAISMVRYLSITHPIKYSSQVKTPSRAAYIIAMVWALALVLNFPSLAGWNVAAQYETYLPLKFIIKHDRGYIIYTVLTTYFLPLFLIIFASVSIIFALRKNRRKIGVMAPTCKQSETNRDGSGDVSSCANDSSVSGAAASMGDKSCFTVSGNMERPPLSSTYPGASNPNLLSPNVFIQHNAARNTSSNLLSPLALMSPDNTHSPTNSTCETALSPSSQTSASSRQSPGSSGKNTPNEVTCSERRSSSEGQMRTPGALTSNDFVQSPPSSSDIDLEDNDVFATLNEDEDSLDQYLDAKSRPPSAIGAQPDTKRDGSSPPAVRVIMVGAASLGIAGSSLCSSPSTSHNDDMPAVESPVLLDGISFVTNSEQPPTDIVVSDMDEELIPPPVLQQGETVASATQSMTKTDRRFLTPPPNLLDTSERPPSPIEHDHPPSVVISRETSSAAKETRDFPSSLPQDKLTTESLDVPNEYPSREKILPSEPLLKAKPSPPGMFLSPPNVFTTADRSPSACSSTNGNFLSPGAGTSLSLSSDACESVSAVRLSFISKAETIISGDCKTPMGSKNNVTMNAISKKFNHQLKVTTDVVIGGNRMTGRAGHKARFRLRDLRERRAVKSLAVIAVFFTVCWTPFYVIYVVTQFCPSCKVPRHLLTFTVWMGYSNSCLNPILYTVFNSAFKDAFLSIWRKIKTACWLGQ